MSGLLVDSDCDGSNESLEDVAAECEAYVDATQPDRIAAALGWQTRDLDRLQHDGTWGSRW